MNTRIIAVVTAIALAAAACGKSDDEASTEDEAATSTEPETTTSTAPPAEDTTTSTTAELDDTPQQENGHLALVLEANYDEYKNLTDADVVHWRSDGTTTTGALGVCFNDDDPGGGDGIHDHTDTAALFSTERVLRGGEWVEITSKPPNPEELELLRDFLLRVQGEVGTDEPIGLDYVLLPAMTYGFGTGDDPTPADGPTNALEGTGGGSSLLIVDSGLPEIHSSGIDGSQATVDKNSRAYNHGLMVASAAHQVAPDANIFVANAATGPEDHITVWTAIEQITELGSGYDNLLLPLGTYGCGPTQIDFFFAEGTTNVNHSEVGRAPEVVIDESTIELLVETATDATADSGTVIAAAGNDSTDRPFWPAAREEVIGVGALDATIANTNGCIDSAQQDFVWVDPTEGCGPTTGLVRFSNTGENVNEAAPGVDIVVHYTDTQTPYSYIGGSTAVLQSWVRVSGTSLAAPIYAACSILDGKAPVCDVRSSD